MIDFLKDHYLVIGLFCFFIFSLIAALIFFGYKIQKNIEEKLSSNNINVYKDLNEAIQNQNKIANEDYHNKVSSLSNSQKDNVEFLSKLVTEKLSDSSTSINTTLTKVLERLLSLENAGNEMDKLSTHILGLEKVLSNKQARGAFGEVQLDKIMEEIFSNYQYTMQKKLSNDSRVDCALNMPNDKVLGIDSKFPLETYKKMVDGDQKSYELHLKQFKVDIKKHIDVISSKYIIPTETSDYAIMFLPSDAIYYEISDSHFDLIDYAQKKKVLIVSPSTIISILLTTHSLLKDEKLYKQIGKIKVLIEGLYKDLELFNKRFEQVELRGRQLNDEVSAVNTSLGKIKSKTEKIKAFDVN